MNAWDANRRAAAELKELNDDLGVDTNLGIPPKDWRSTAPLVLDTDIGGDADDAVALVAAAQDPELALVITSDETENLDRARFARLLLDDLDRPEVPVVAGATLGSTGYLSVDTAALPTTLPPHGPDAIHTHIERLTAHGGVRWVGLGPMSNLAALVSEHPEMAEQLAVTQMGFAINYRHPDRAEHNVRRDVAAARHVLNHCPHLELVLSDVTFTPELALTPEHPLGRRVAASTRPWARHLHDHLTRWWRGAHPETLQHDALTLSVALGLPLVYLSRARVALDEIGRLRRTDEGIEVWLSDSADYARFWGWLSRRFDQVLT